MPKSNELVTSDNVLGEKGKAKTIAEVVHEKLEYKVQGTLCHKGNSIYYIQEYHNANPKDVEEINSSVLVVTPMPAWERVCINNCFTKTQAGAYAQEVHQLTRDFTNVSNTAALLSIVSQAYKTNEGRAAAFYALMDVVQNDLDKVIDSIEKRKAQANSR